MSDDTPENPPAFPPAIAVSPSGDVYPGYDGMTLRDWFAGQVVAALATEHHGNDWGREGTEHAPLCARKAYAIADAMLAERKRS